MPALVEKGRHVWKMHDSLSMPSLNIDVSGFGMLAYAVHYPAADKVLEPAPLLPLRAVGDVLVGLPCPMTPPSSLYPKRHCLAPAKKQSTQFHSLRISRAGVHVFFYL
jgi:hypothetical protein